MATIDFIPKRLNDPPVVFRGMTMREMAFSAFIGFGVFSLPGVVIAIVFGMLAMAPTVAFAGTGATVWFGGTIMRRLRRGRPPALLYRQMHWKLAEKGIPLGGEHLIIQSCVYRIARDRRAQGDRP